MHGIKLITQMVFLLLYFIFPSPEEIDVISPPERDISFLYSSIGAYYTQVEELAQSGPALEEVAPIYESMEEELLPEEAGTVSWEDEYETPVAHGNALVTSTKVQIVSGPYAGICLTADEVDMMECVIQRETNGTLKHRKIIAELILNRVKSEKFPNTVKEVLTAPRQFSTINNYYTKKRPPDQTTKQAVWEVLKGEGLGNSKGAFYFYDPQWANPKNAKWFENDLTFCFELEGHRFFK